MKTKIVCSPLFSEVNRIRSGRCLCNEMPDGFVIKQFLMVHRSEVRGIIDTEYNEAEVMEGFKNEGRAEGHAAGLAEGHAAGLAEGHAAGLTEGETIKLIKQVYLKLRKNKPIEQIADELEESDNITKIRVIVDLIRKTTPELVLDEEELTQDVLEKLSIMP